jgi:hypothetical protein
MSKRLMIALCITAMTMLVTEAKAFHCRFPLVHIGNSCVPVGALRTDQSWTPLESEADLAMLVNEAIANDQPIQLRMPGSKPGDQGLSGKSEKVAQQKVQEMLKALNRAPDSVRVIFK